MSENQGLSIEDIAPQVELVPIGEKFLSVYGVSAEGIVSLFKRFPQMKGWFSGGAFAAEDLIKEAPDGIAAIIAAGCGAAGSTKAEKYARLYPVETQLDILEAIGRLSFKNGFGPFVLRVVALCNAAASVNYGRVRGTNSPQPSKDSSPSDTTQPSFGN